MEHWFEALKERTSYEYEFDDEYTDLRYAIVLQAVKDYVYAREYVRDRKAEYMESKAIYPDKNKAPYSVRDRQMKFELHERLIPDCEHFFRSAWFSALAPQFDGEAVIKRLHHIKYDQLKVLIRNNIKEV